MSLRSTSLLRWALRSQAGALAASSGASVVRQVMLLAVPYFVQRAIDDGIRTGDLGTAGLWALAVAVAAAVHCAGLVGWAWWANLADARVGVALRGRLAVHVAALDDGDLNDGDLGRGDLAMRVTRDVDQVRVWVHGLPTWAVIGTTFAVTLPAITALDPVLLYATLAMIPPLVLVNVYYPPRFGRALDTLSDAHADRADAVADLLSASAAVRGLGGEGRLVERHHERSAAVFGATVAAARISATWAALGPMVPRLAVAAGIGFGGFAVLDGTMTVGGLVAFTSWMITITLAVRVSVDRLIDRKQAVVAAGRLTEVLALRPRMPDPDHPAPLPASGELTASGLVAVKGGRVIGPLDLTVRPGELVVLTGPVGSGKSTMLRLLGRREAPQTGSVAYGGVDLTAASSADTAATLVLVPQRPVLVSGTIADNLKLGRDLDQQELLAACRAAALDLPLDTEAGERGGALSGGQVQRLAVARALLGRPPVLLLDDITSALDTDTEARLLAGLRTWAPHTAIVIASHRPAVVEAADRVIDLALAEVAHG
ncbi:ATP-binding cassette, subfamily B [Sinosporangium album]|uniref:ATP-binding cassette, subfamily B n=1 Tax=Sinosporangium album TaxID=504805 RepID=A0A1G8HMV6_9ACTN|nr:ABC transporter ATP-binding protein [Sinosporangium album]SDI07922.1 ATP-binding cassette, subfamily B [Sinosporangium album]